jgi:hypothetical protein
MASPQPSAREDPLAGRSDRVPDAVVATAKAAFLRAALPGSLVRLAFDSDQDRLDATGPRRLRFEHDGAALDVAVTADGDLRHVTAWSEPVADLTIERYSDPPQAPVVVNACDAATASKGDLVRVAVHRAGARPPLLHSEWFRA